MKKKTVKKMTLTRETLRDLQGSTLQEAVGASHNPSHCNTDCDTICLGSCATCTCETRRTCKP